MSDCSFSTTVSCLSTSEVALCASKVLPYNFWILSLFSTSIRSQAATFSACRWNSFWYFERSDAHLVVISSIDLFLSLDWAVGAGPDVEAPRFDLPAAVIASLESAAFVVEECSAAVDAGVASFKGLDNAGAFAKDEPLVADVLAAVSLDLSAGLPRFWKRVFEEAAGAVAGPELEVVICAPVLKRLDAVVVGADDSAGLDVTEGKLNAGLDALDPVVVAVFANNDEELACLGGAVVVD